MKIFIQLIISSFNLIDFMLILNKFIAIQIIVQLKLNKI